ncbi:16S rRNA (guanine(527)-N(7))-methyltransferase RsmG [Bacillus cereus]
MNIEQFQSMLEEKGITLSSRQLEQFKIYFETLVEWNEKNELNGYYRKRRSILKTLFLIPLQLLFYYDFSKPFSICDVGAGAGFPSIPLKICFPHLKVTIVDSLQKRINFLNHLAQKLELSDVAFCHDRAETFGKKEGVRESYDIVMARAVARLSVLSELCLPLVKVGGTFIAMKGAAANEEIENGKYALEVLGGELKEMSTFQLPFEESERNILLIEKKRKTPKKYPRKPGTPNKLPIEK